MPRPKPTKAEAIRRKMAKRPKSKRVLRTLTEADMEAIRAVVAGIVYAALYPTGLRGRGCT